ncbi:GxxExxY protein [Alkalicella caledoniensis]|uniref:GxxExxY protein n=1 Tax=Alkalicella caledoniensis TaxID=2731377 RepID=A0A7G9W435_ALKCA|nr:GxxExxY protein [Alkalicella caledoniensis]QNO13447.1 GxxExxY protein [Alkalicella caledoniensis]
MLYQELTSQIIKCAYEVHKTLGHGFYESIYHNALIKELEKRRIPHISEAKLDVYYKGESVGFYFADIFVDEKVIVEIKAVSKLSQDHKQQVLNYLKASKTDVGLIFNFGESDLSFKRFINTMDEKR